MSAVDNFEKGNHVDYIKVPSDYGLTDFNNVVKGWEDIKDLWFGGYLYYDDYKLVIEVYDNQIIDYDLRMIN